MTVATEADLRARVIRLTSALATDDPGGIAAALHGIAPPDARSVLRRAIAMRALETIREEAVACIARRHPGSGGEAS